MRIYTEKEQAEQHIPAARNAMAFGRETFTVETYNPFCSAVAGFVIAMYSRGHFCGFY